MFAVLSDLNCDVVDAKLWTHNGRVASVIYLKDCNSGSPILDSLRVSKIEARLKNVLNGDNDVKSAARTCVSMDTMTHIDRRLHQLMFEDRDYERRSKKHERSPMVVVTVQNWAERSYSVVNVYCRDRTKLLFDVVCTLTDMEYSVFHATINTSSDQAHLVCSHNLANSFKLGGFSCDLELIEMSFLVKNFRNSISGIRMVHR